VKLCFSKKRKTLVNNLREDFSPESVRGALGAVGLRLDVRAEQIAIEDLGRLFTALKK
jgi:16S rRNA A1518/A1519 N6-dimethyltransferase RsmA/KsgA/DIM1 with predicted DNA glycosylase/AP lyase activity